MTTSSGMNMVMTTIGFSVSTLFIVFICTRLICARIHLRLSRRSFHLSSRSDLSSLERGSHGLEPVLLANFPVKKYRDEYFASAEDSQCMVCLAEYNPEDVLRIISYCGHYFHINCIDIWLLQHCTCPVCRISLREVNEKRRLMQPLFSSRSHYGGADSAALMHSHDCLLAGGGHQCSSRTQGNHRNRMDSVQGNNNSSVSTGESSIPSVEGESGDGSMYLKSAGQSQACREPRPSSLSE
ncbi:hypothetical protein Dimus_011566 [Dionaea muscipula]